MTSSVITFDFFFFFQQICQKTTGTLFEHDSDVDKPVTPPEKVPQSQVASSSGLAAPSSTVAIPKRSPGRPPGSTIQVRLLTRESLCHTSVTR